eukprot:m.209340 g.209340  ORF g.209340 m.209340 type:complete len:76 (-) comp33036_c0_seq1:436-663(-)
MVVFDWLRSQLMLGLVTRALSDNSSESSNVVLQLDAPTAHDHVRRQTALSQMISACVVFCGFAVLLHTNDFYGRF